MGDVALLLPLLVLIGAMFLMTRSAKKKQQQAVAMRDQMQPGTGVRTIGGLYATVKEINEDTVLLELAPGTHAVFAKNAIGAVLEDDEFHRIVHGEAPDDASSLSGDTAGGDDPADGTRTDLSKDSDVEESPAEGAADTEPKKDDGEPGTK